MLLANVSFGALALILLLAGLTIRVSKKALYVGVLKRDKESISLIIQGKEELCALNLSLTLIQDCKF